MGNEYIEHNVDPWANDAIDGKHVKSVEFSGAFLNETAPAAANFPIETGSPTRYFLAMPLSIDVSDLAGSKPFILKDVTSATTLTRVTSAPGVNEFRVPPDTSNRRSTIELHSGQAGNTLGYDYYGIGTILTAFQFESRIDINGKLLITNTDDSTSINTGCFIIDGGAGIEKRITVGGRIVCDDTTQATNSTDGSIQTDGGISCAMNIFTAGSINVTANAAISGQLNANNVTDSNSISSGSFVCAGGVGIAKKLFIGGSINVTDTTTSTTKDTGSIITEGGVGIEENLNVGGVFKIANTTASTTKDTGCAIFEGGLGIEKDISVGDAVRAVNGWEAKYRTTAPAETVLNIQHKVVAIGDWDMNTLRSISLTINLDEAQVNIVAVDGVIIGDPGVGHSRFSSEYFNLVTGLSKGGGISVEWNGGLTTLQLTRFESGYFDNSNYDSTSYNRGYVYITYFI